MGLTLEDVGRYCGVSRSTVSRVINASPLVNEKTRRKVLDAIEKLGYAPNFVAQSLMTNRTETIAVALPDITGGVYPEILAGMDEEAGRLGYHVLVVFVGGTRPEAKTVEKLIRQRRADAVVCMATAVSEKVIRDLMEDNVPLVRLAGPAIPPSVPGVAADNRGGARAAVRLLHERGCRRILHLRGPESNYDAAERAQGYLDALEELGMAEDDALIVDGAFAREGGRRAIREIISADVHIDGVFAANDEMALGAAQELVAAGRRIPDDVSIIGFDDIDTARFAGLSSVRVELREVGRTAARLALGMLSRQHRDDEAGMFMLPAKVVERASTLRGIGKQTFMFNEFSE